jgi:hypothetical protein
VRSLRSSGGALILTATTIVVANGVVSAHRLDECLQAARIAVEADHVAVELALTPGIATADSIIGEIDRDADGLLSAEEQRAYESTTISALRVEVDGRALPLSSTAYIFPDPAELRTGTGIILLRMSALVSQTVGDHHVTFTNEHHPAGSVYLANALVPGSDRIAVTAQRRDANQQTLTIDYNVRRASTPPSVLLMVIIAMIALPALWRAGLLQRMRTRAVAADTR